MDEFGSTSEVEAHTDADVDAGIDASIDTSTGAGSVVGLDELEAARDEGPSTDRELRRKRLAAMMFGEDTGPSHFGRYLLLEHLGEGGVGTVQLAYDAELDRRVALKLLRAHHNVSEAARLRMRREAQALARLSHPNVVPVYETGVIDGQVYIVMEFVVGQTLRAWVRGGEAGQTRRSWSEILEVYLQAARGLAAAHATGVVHRDFKPDNAILGEDGRVRVLDFGLARDARSSAEETAPPEVGDAEQTGGSLDPDASGRAALGLDEHEGEDALEHAVTRPDANPSARSGSQPAGEGWVFERTSTGERPSSFDEDLTATGAVLGTPAYMAPEQYLRAKVGPTADQYSFCAALFEALYDRRPFAGKTLSELRAAVLRGELDEPVRKGVPRWLFPILARGLSRDPESRHPSMDALITELARDRQRTRRRVLAGAGAVALMLGTAAGVWGYKDAADARACSGGAAEVAAVWSPQRREAIDRALGDSELAYAREVRPRILDGLDRYADDLASMRREACEVHRRHEQSDYFFDLRTTCLERRLSALDSAAELLAELEPETATPASLSKAVELVGELPRVQRCAELDALSAALPPPEDPALAASVETLRREAIHAQTLERAGRYGPALAAARELRSEAEPLDYAPLLAELDLLTGRVLVKMDERAGALAPLREASVTAYAWGMHAVGVEARARHLYVAATVSPEAAAAPGVDTAQTADLDLALAEALVRGDPDGAFAHTLLLNNAGIVAMSRGQLEPARDYLGRALEVLDAHPELRELELSSVAMNLALLSPEPTRRRALVERSVRALDDELGPAHPMTLNATLLLSHAVADRPEAVELRAPTCARYRRFHPDQLQASAECLYALAFLRLSQRELQDDAASDAAAVFAELPGFSDASSGPDTRAVARIAEGYVELLDGSPILAERRFGEALALLAPLSEQWWLDRHVAHAELGRGLSLRARYRHEAASEAFAAAEARLRAITERSHDVDLDRDLARVRALWAESLIAVDRERAQARTLLNQSRVWYADAGPDYAGELAAVDRALDAL